MIQQTLSPHNQSSSMSNHFILVVDDQEINLFVASESLQSLGFCVDVCGDGKGALEATEKKKYDAILIDMCLPDIEGTELCRQIRSKPGYSDIRIIALTANNSEYDKKKCIDAGMNGFITKPMNPEILIKFHIFLNQGDTNDFVI